MASEQKYSEEELKQLLSAIEKEINSLTLLHHALQVHCDEINQYGESYCNADGKCQYRKGRCYAKPQEKLRYLVDEENRLRSIKHRAYPVATDIIHRQQELMKQFEAGQLSREAFGYI